MQPDDQIRIRHMVDACRSVERFIEGQQQEDLDRDEKLCFALIRAIEIIGEAAGKVSEETRQLSPEIPWREAVGIRNRLIHAYFDVDTGILWKTATEAVPELLLQLEQLVQQEG